MRFRFVLQLDALLDNDPDGLEPREIRTNELTINTNAGAEPRLIELFGEINQQFAKKLAALRAHRRGGNGNVSTSASPL